MWWNEGRIVQHKQKRGWDWGLLPSRHPSDLLWISLKPRISTKEILFALSNLQCIFLSLQILSHLFIQLELFLENWKVEKKFSDFKLRISDLTVKTEFLLFKTLVKTQIFWNDGNFDWEKETRDTSDIEVKNGQEFLRLFVPDVGSRRAVEFFLEIIFPSSLSPVSFLSMAWHFSPLATCQGKRKLCILSFFFSESSHGKLGPLTRRPPYFL